MTTSSSNRVLTLVQQLALVDLPYDGMPTPITTFTDNFKIPSLLFILGF